MGYIVCVIVGALAGAAAMWFLVAKGEVAQPKTK